MAAAAVPDAQQLFLNAQAAAQLAVLPTFSNIFKDDNFKTTQWQQKVINHKTGAAGYGTMSKRHSNLTSEPLPQLLW